MNDVDLRTYIEAQLKSLREYIQVQLQAHEETHVAARQSGLMFWENHRREHDAEHEAVALANEALGKRLDGMNEFRGQLRDQQATLVARTLFDASMKAVDVRLSRMENFQARLLGMGVVGMVIAGVLGGLLAKVLGL